MPYSPPAAASALALALVACGGKPAPSSAPSATPAGVADSVRDLVAAEELILTLSPKLAELDPATLPVWPAGPAETSTDLPHLGLRFDSFNNPTSGAGETLPDGASLSLVDGHFTSTGAFHTTAEFSSTMVRATLETTWTRTGDGPADWSPGRWAARHVTRTFSTGTVPLFSDALAEVLPDSADRDRATTSLHRKILLDNYFGGRPADLPAGLSDPRFFPDSLNVHPALSVVDIDGDGWDDLYLCVRWGPNLLFVNNRDGTFSEQAARYGLDLNGRSTSATFADLDNDGDPDLVLGRSLEKSLLLHNIGGRFEPADPQPPLPALVTSTAAADVDRDGLLDVIFTTYSPLDINARTTDPTAPPAWASQFLTEPQAAEVARRNSDPDRHAYLAQVGPPDQLFLNIGGGQLVPAPPELAAVLAGYTNSFQATFADADGDGDPDLYIATDFAPDRFLENTTPSPGAPPTFSDTTADSGFTAMGFGMGASFGDVDNDGRAELYVSNMYSKAGRRITAKLPGLDPRLAAASAGNRLYRSTTDGPRFALDPDLTRDTANAGWSWGGDFLDIDNDGYLDLYVSSGFYTAPEEHALPVDL